MSFVGANRFKEMAAKIALSSAEVSRSLTALTAGTVQPKKIVALIYEIAIIRRSASNERNLCPCTLPCPAFIKARHVVIKLLPASIHARFGDGFSFPVGTAFGTVANRTILFMARLTIDQVFSDRTLQRYCTDTIVAISCQVTSNHLAINR